MKTKITLTLLLLIYSFLAIFAQNKIEGTWILPKLNNSGYINYNTKYKKKKDNIIPKGKELGSKELTVTDGKIYHSQYFIEYFFTDISDKPEDKRAEYHDYESKVYLSPEISSKKQEVIFDDYRKYHDIDKVIEHNKDQVTIVFYHQRRTKLGFLTFHFINPEKAYLKGAVNLDTLYDTQKMKIDLSIEDLPIIYSQKEFKNLQKQRAFPTDNESKYLEWWHVYLEEVQKEENKAKLKNLGLEFQMNMLNGHYFTTQLKQKTLEKLGYNTFSSLDSVRKTIEKFAYPEELRALIRGKVSQEQIDEVIQKLNQNWYANLIYPSGEMQFDETQFLSVQGNTEIQYPKIKSYSKVEGLLPKQVFRKQEQRITMDIQKVLIGTNETNGTLVIKTPSEFPTRNPDEIYSIIQFEALSDSSLGFTSLSPRTYKSIEDASRQFRDINKNKYNSPIYTLIKKELYDEKYSKLPVLDPKTELSDSIVKVIEKDFEENYKSPYPEFDFGDEFELVSYSRQLMMFTQIKYKASMIQLGYHPDSSYKTFIINKIEEKKEARLKKVETQLSELQTKLSQIQKDIATPDSVKEHGKRYFIEYALDKTTEEIKVLEKQFDILKLEATLDTLKKYNKGNSPEASKVRLAIKFEKEAQTFYPFEVNSINNGSGEWLQHSRESLTSEIKELDSLEKTLSKEEKEKQRQARKKEYEKELKLAKKKKNSVEEPENVFFRRLEKGRLSFYYQEIEDANYEFNEDRNKLQRLKRFIDENKESFPERIKPIQDMYNEAKKLSEEFLELINEVTSLCQKLEKMEEWEAPEE